MPEPTIPQVSIVGSETLLGSDLRELLRESILGSRLKLLGSAEPGTAVLSVEQDEPVVIVPIDDEALNASRIVFLTGPAEVNHKAFAQIRPGPAAPVVIDLTRSLEGHPFARLRAPMAETAGTTVTSQLHVIAHPAAILVATILQRLSTVGELRRSVITAFEPASERGMAGIEELQQQTVSLLNFKQQNHSGGNRAPPCLTHFAHSRRTDAQPAPATDRRDARTYRIAVGAVCRTSRPCRNRSRTELRSIRLPRRRYHAAQPGGNGHANRHRRRRS
jgi:aspartate-semialdehyde dehydrogenase